MRPAETHRQQRIERFFQFATSSRPKPKGCSFLDLPASVRRRIYEAAQVIPRRGVTWAKISLGRRSIAESGCVLDAPTDEAEESSSDAFHEAESCHRCRIRGSAWHAKECRPLPLGLFLACSAVYRETVHLFYSRNRFEIAYAGPDTLSALERLGPRAVASLRSLTIHMTTYNCRGKSKCKSPEHQLGCHRCCMITPHDEPLGSHSGSRNEIMAVEALRRACRHLATGIAPNQLRFALSCEVLGGDIAGALLSCLSCLPTLRSCAISLSRDFDPVLRKMAQETSLRLTGYPESRVTGSFPLRQLPRELQLRILGFSGLVAPFHLWYDELRDRPDIAISTATCLYEKPSWKAETLVDCFGDLPVVCCCSAGFHSTSTWACNHWHFPFAVFAVDRLMRDDARTTMYRGNVWTGFPRSCYSQRSPQLHAAAEGNKIRFLGQVRWLSCNLGTEGAQGVIETVLTHCNPRNLTLVLRLPHPSHQRERELGDISTAPWEKHREYMDCVNATLASRPDWRRLKGFFVHILRPHVLLDPSGHGGIYHLDCSTSDAQQAEAEFDLERMVVGAGFALDASRATKRANIHINVRSDNDWSWPWNCPVCFGSTDTDSQMGYSSWLYHG